MFYCNITLVSQEGFYKLFFTGPLHYQTQMYVCIQVCMHVCSYGKRIYELPKCQLLGTPVIYTKNKSYYDFILRRLWPQFEPQRGGMDDINIKGIWRDVVVSSRYNCSKELQGNQDPKSRTPTYRRLLDMLDPNVFMQPSQLAQKDKNWLKISH